MQNILRLRESIRSACWMENRPRRMDGGASLDDDTVDSTVSRRMRGENRNSSSGVMDKLELDVVKRRRDPGTLNRLSSSVGVASRVALRSRPWLTDSVSLLVERSRSNKLSVSDAVANVLRYASETWNSSVTSATSSTSSGSKFHWTESTFVTVFWMGSRNY